MQIGFFEKSKPTFRSISITMRTPGSDFELAAGFFFSEGIIKSADDVLEIRHCGPAAGDHQTSNVVRLALRDNIEIDLERLQRHFYTTSSCGVCGKSSIEALKTVRSTSVDPLSQPLRASILHQLPRTLGEQQRMFRSTGGIHAAALFDLDGKLITIHEDVGRHNAVDKVIGDRLLNRKFPLNDSVLMVSGRASFELVQKAIVAGIPLLASVSAPSSLAIELARQFGITLVGFVRDDRFNIYTGANQLQLEG